MSRSSSFPDSDLEPSTDRYERLLDVQRLMARLSRDIGPALELDQVLTTVLGAMRSLVRCDGGVISLAQDDHLVVVALDPATKAVPPPERISSSTWLAVRVLTTGASARTADLGSEPRIGEAGRATARRLDIASFLCVPLICLGDVIGTIQVWSTDVDVFDDEHQLVLEGLATQVAGVIEGARRYEMISQLEVLKSDFIARVSHELRTPITIMSGFVSTLITNHERLDNETRRQMLERVDVATARLSGLIDQLLMLSRLESGVVAANVEPVAAAGMLDEVRRQAERPEDLDISCAEDLQFTTDGSLLVRAIGLLVDNALKYAGPCRIEASEGVIDVIDHGPGIPVGRRSQVFEKFTRANEDTTVPGMGIGLPMARTLLAAAGADLRIEEPAGGTGTRMVIRFW